MRREVIDVHLELSMKAAEKANEKVVADPRIPPEYTRIFRGDARRGIGLQFSQGFYGLGDEFLEVLREIGREALKETLIENPTLIGGLIIGEARAGRNYFARFR